MWPSSPIDVDAGAQSSHDKWAAPGPRIKWKEVSHTVNQQGVLAKRQEESKVVRNAQKEAEIMLMADELVGVEN